LLDSTNAGILRCAQNDKAQWFFSGLLETDSLAAIVRDIDAVNQKVIKYLSCSQSLTLW